MCKRNSHDKNKASMGCIRETPPIKKRNQYGRCKRNFPERKKKKERKKEEKKLKKAAREVEENLLA